jgi:putative ABC transport system permease protein
MWRDVRLALRQLRKSPAFTLVVLATLGLCIGVNAAVYSVLDAVLLRFLEDLLFGVRSTDPLTFAATAGILLLVTVLASLIPALRILRMDPARTLRNE